MLGYLYQIGSGTTKNLSRAIYWYEQAAAKRESMAMFNLGVLYQKGRGVNKDINQAKDLFRKSEALGNRQAAAALKKMDD
jgi:TPR repeat protein